MNFKHPVFFFCRMVMHFVILLTDTAPLFGQQSKNDTIQSRWLHIRKIEFAGNRITKPIMIVREMSLRAGDSIRAEDLETELIFNKKRILNLLLFSTVNYTAQQSDADSVDIEYQLTEILYWLASPIFSLADRNFNVWWFEQNRELSRTNIGLEFTRINFRGRNERLGGIVQMGYNKHFNLFYKIPFIDKKLRQGLGLSMSYSTGREINYTTDSNKIYFFRSEYYPYQKVDFRVGYTYRKAYATTHELTLGYHFFQITPALFALNPDFLGNKSRINYFELNYTFRFNNTDVRIYPINGLEQNTTITKRGLGIDKDINQLILYNETSFYQPIHKNISASFVFRGRLMFPQQQPYLLNRAMGFRNEYIRGYEYYVIDGSHFALLRSNIRYKILDVVWHQNLLKFIKYIPIKIYGKVYDDMGAVYHHRAKNYGNSFLNNRFLNGFGAGIDLVISYYAKFRIEYSFNHLNQNGLFLHGNKE